MLWQCQMSDSLWDPHNADADHLKQGISFGSAFQLFLEPLHKTRQDRIEGVECRWRAISQIYGMTVNLVAHSITVRIEPEMIELIHITSTGRTIKVDREQNESEDR